MTGAGVEARLIGIELKAKAELEVVRSPGFLHSWTSTVSYLPIDHVVVHALEITTAVDLFETRVEVLKTEVAFRVSADQYQVAGRVRLRALSGSPVYRVATPPFGYRWTVGRRR